MFALVSMEVRLTPELEHQLDDLAARTGRPVDQLAATALARGLEEERRFLEAVERGIESADAGRFVEDEQVLAWLDLQTSVHPRR